jgi:hypothetical protein
MGWESILLFVVFAADVVTALYLPILCTSCYTILSWFSIVQHYVIEGKRTG